MVRCVQRPRGPLGISDVYSHLRWPSDVTQEQVDNWEKEYKEKNMGSLSILNADAVSVQKQGKIIYITAESGEIEMSDMVSYSGVYNADGSTTHTFKSDTSKPKSQPSKIELDELLASMRFSMKTMLDNRDKEGLEFLSLVYQRLALV